MNFELEKKWSELVNSLGKKEGEKPSIDSVIFVIGLQELNMDMSKLTKDQKLEVMHVGLCAIFTPYGYYEPLGRDEEGWIHFKTVKKFPNLNQKEQEEVIKEAIIEYYK
jgi:hypothetical protein